MPLRVTCPGCQSDYQLQDHLAGKTVACGKCGDTLRAHPAPVVSTFASAPPLPTSGPRPIAGLPERKPVKGNSGLAVGLVLALVACGMLFFGTVAAAVVGLVMYSARATVAANERAAAAVALGDQPVVTPVALEPEAPAAPDKPAVKPPPVVPEEPAMAGTIPVETMQAIKAATVFIKADSAIGSASGSGFLVRVEGDSGFVVTNHHVIGPIKIEEPEMRPGNPANPINPIRPINPRLPIPVPRVPAPPRPIPGRPIAHVIEARATLTVVFESGTPNEQSAPAEIVNDDEHNDLAVLKVTGLRNLPKPLSCGNTPPLVETMPVYMFGFPFGKALAMNKGNPAITVGKGSVSSIRRDDRGTLHYIQLDGDLNPGNSGGPVVDSRGRLVGVAVAKIVQTNIGLAIPPEKLKLLLEGKPDEPRVEAAPPRPRPVPVPVPEVKSRGVGKVGSLTVTRSRPSGESKEVAYSRWYYDASNSVSGTESKKQYVFVPGQELPAEDENHRKVTIEAALNDPDHKLQNVSILVRLADGYRIPDPPAGGEWAALPDALALELNVEGANAKGEVEVPVKGDVFYFQMSYRNAEGKTIYTEPKSFNVNLGKKPAKKPD